MLLNCKLINLETHAFNIVILSILSLLPFFTVMLDLVFFWNFSWGLCYYVATYWQYLGIFLEQTEKSVGLLAQIDEHSLAWIHNSADWTQDSACTTFTSCACGETSENCRRHKRSIPAMSTGIKDGRGVNDIMKYPWMVFIFNRLEGTSNIANSATQFNLLDLMKSFWNKISGDTLKSDSLSHEFWYLDNQLTCLDCGGVCAQGGISAHQDSIWSFTSV